MTKKKKKILLGVGGALGLAIATLLGVAATQPDMLDVTREIRVSATPDAVFQHLDDFHRWTAWSPYEQLDPNLQRDYSEPASGEGAHYAWRGNSKAGAGSMTVIERTPGEQLVIRLDFKEPMTSTALAIFRVTPDEAAARVSWTMQGVNSFPGKLASLFIDMDAMIGKDFETGLANLKRLSELNAATATR